MYDLKDYKEVRKGAILIENIPWPNTILLQNVVDTNYTACISYEDSLFKVPRSIHFFYKGVGEGPMKSYVSGRLFMEGFYKGGKRDGELVIYGENLVRNRQHFKGGVKVDTWEEYDDHGKLIRKTVYDNNGKVISDTNY